MTRAIPWIPLGLAVLTSMVQAGDWTHWRGANRNGIIDEHSGWTGGEWKLRDSWSKDVGEGSTAPLVVGRRVFTMGWAQGRDTVMCLETGSGETVWSSDYPCPRYGRLALGDQGLYSGPSATPEFDAESQQLFTLSIDGHLHCWAAESGDSRWTVNLHETFDVQQRPRVARSGHRDYGFSGSPVVVEDCVVVEAGATEGTLIAFDKRTGKVRWTSEANSPAGHTGGCVPIDVDGIPCLLVHNFEGLLVTRVDGKNAGKTLAAYPWKTTFANNIATPTVHGNTVIATSAYNHFKIAKFVVERSGFRKVWEQKHASKVCSPVVRNGYVYWAWRKVMCLDFDTGERIWEGGRVGDQGSLIVTSDDRLISWTNRGDLLLANTATRSQDAYQELASRTRLGKTDAWPHVVLANGRLYCKTRDGRIQTFQVR